uniref:TIL domain-containing protein n=1 Tax=Heliothis virescens TaxID=7102 RepID=A0A2A4J1V2_HELVI
MKTVLVFLVVAVSAIMVQGQGIPIAKCPPGEHSVLYCPQMAEPSCDNPTVHELKVPGPCDIPQCFCNTPNVRNTKTGKCVKLANC